MNLNPGRGSHLDVERQSSPIRHRGYVNPALPSSPPLRAGIAASNSLFAAADSASTSLEEQETGSGTHLII